jgi:Resolvase, N terminal domain
MADAILPQGNSRSPSARAAIYARVSTTNNGQDPAMQTRELVEYCDRRNWEVSNQYIDAGFSGAKDSRPELNRLMADAHRRHFDAVVVWRFDRFARSVSHLLRALETFKALGIEFVSLSEQVDTSMMETRSRLSQHGGQCEPWNTTYQFIERAAFDQLCKMSWKGVSAEVGRNSLGKEGRNRGRLWIA